ncbi:MAG: Glu/Leu/Phe/Val dehydrogenase [Chitinophagales bacterium]
MPLQSNTLETMHDMEHEQVLFFQDGKTGLKGIIAVHDTTLGPALGGCRIWNYERESDAVWDVLRLSRGMTFKSAISGINLGGGKAVIISGNKDQRTEAFWSKFGSFVDSLGGKYITAEDVGTSTREISYIMQRTLHVAGKPESAGGTGDPSPFTAYGVFLGLKASANTAFGSDDLAGKRVSVQGVGHVGKYLVGHLTKAGAKVFVSDINDALVKEVVREFGATAVDKDAIYDLDVDIYAPCALGATVNNETLSRLKCAVIAGAANNQLADEKAHGALLLEKGILYAPDFLINAGGVINCYREVSGLTEKQTMPFIEAIYNKTKEIFARSKAEQIPTQEAAIRIAKERIAEKKK